MSPDERAKQLVINDNVTVMVGSRHENPGLAVALIAEAIRAAVEAERDRCAAVATELAANYRITAANAGLEAIVADGVAVAIREKNHQAHATGPNGATTRP